MNEMLSLFDLNGSRPRSRRKTKECSPRASDSPPLRLPGRLSESLEQGKEQLFTNTPNYLSSFFIKLNSSLPFPTAKTNLSLTFTAYVKSILKTSVV